MNEPQQPRPPANPQQPHHPSIRPIGAAAVQPQRAPGSPGAPGAPVRRIEPPPPHVVPPIPPAARNATVPPPPHPAQSDPELINLEDEEPIALEEGPATPVAPAPARLPAMGATGAAGAAAPAAAAAQAQATGLSTPSKIKFYAGGDKHTYTKFKRQTHVAGTGACRVRSFHGRLSDDGLAYTDDKINEWLDNHPEVEIKHVNCLIGPLEGKVTGEQGLVVVIWY